MTTTPHKLKLSPALRDAFEEEIIEEVKEAMRGTNDRNSFFLECYEMMRGTTPVQTSARWNDACNLQYQLVRKMQLILMAQYVNAVKRNPKVIAEAHEVENEESASAQEAFLSSKDQELAWTKNLITAARFDTSVTAYGVTSRPTPYYLKRVLTLTGQIPTMKKFRPGPRSTPFVTPGYATFIR